MLTHNDDIYCMYIKISVTTDRGFVRVSSFCHRETEVEVSEGKKKIFETQMMNYCLSAR